MNRLFLLAAYDPQGQVSPALLYYAQALASLGKLVCYADSEMAPLQLDLLQDHTLYAGASRHGEYDFGSYKRAWQWAAAHLDLRCFDRVYLLNDSVYPTGGASVLEPFFQQLEALDAQAVGAVYNPDPKGPHLQSWLLCFKPEVFLHPAFGELLLSVEHQQHKWMICGLYEHGLTRLVWEEGFQTDNFLISKGKEVYNHPLRLCRKGLPFFKKSAITRHGGAYRYQVRAILERFCKPDCAQLIREDIERLYGAGVLNDLDRSCALQAPLRLLRYGLGKLKK